MARHSARLRRLTARLRGHYANINKVRLARMSDEALLAEVARQARQEGCPEDQLPRDLDATLVWLEKQQRASLAALSEEDQAECLARLPRLRALLPS